MSWISTFSSVRSFGVWEEKSACREELWVVPVTLDTHNPDISKSWLTRRILYGYYTLLKWFVFLSCLDDCVIQILNTRIKHDKRHEERHWVSHESTDSPSDFSLSSPRRSGWMFYLRSRYLICVWRQRSQIATKKIRRTGIEGFRFLGFGS